jgi:hypothetical protein
MPDDPQLYQLSLCVPASTSNVLIQEFSDNISHFFQKFPVKYEILFAVNPEQDEGLSLLQSLAESNPHYQIVANKKHLSRAENFEMLFKKAKGDILVATDLDLAAPLSEIFKMLEVFYSNPEVEIVFGDRSKSKKKLEQARAVEAPLETFFKGIIKEKTPWPYQDPFCPLLGMRKSCFEKLAPELKSSGWYWTHEVQRVVKALGLKSEEIPLYVGSRKVPSPEGLGACKEALHLLQFVLFRI